MNDLAQVQHVDILQSQVQQLVDEGLETINPARFRYIQSLAERAITHNDKTRTLLSQKVQAAVKQYRLYCQSAQAQQTLQDADPGATQPTNNTLALIRQQIRHRASQQAISPQRAALNDLIEELLGEDNEQPSDNLSLSQQMLQQEAEAARQLNSIQKLRPANAELKSISAFRETWNRQHADQLVDTSVNQGPKDAGPLNPERLAIRSLSAVRELSPQYLKRFVSYIETLMWLQQLESQSSSSRKKPGTKK